MANGYLGKISAIVTANTSELSRNLNAGAKDVRAFAQTVSRDIGRVSSDAQRQFSQIFTPLQKFERALQAAASQKLSFKGFDGAIRTVEQLRSRLASLKDQNIINLAVKASGLGSINELRESIKDVGNREIRILAEVGGRDKVRALLEELKEAGRSSVRIKVGTVGVEQLESALTLVKGFTQRQVNILTNVGGLDKIRELRNTLSDTDGKAVVVNVGEVNAEELDKIAARLSSLDNKTIKAVIDVVGQASLDAALRKQRDLASAAQDIFRPLATATSQFNALSVVIQNEFAGSLGRAQNASERLKNSIDDSTEISASRFGRVRRAVESVAEALNRTSQLQQRASSVLGAGRSIELRAPGAVGAVDRANAVVQEIRQSPEAVRANPQVQQTVSDIEKAIERLITLQGRFESRASRGESVARVTREIERQIGAVDRLAELYRTIRVGLFAPFDDVLGQAQSVTSAFNALSAASRVGLAELEAGARAAVNAFQRTGQGVSEAAEAVARFSAGVSAASSVDSVRNMLAGVGGGGGGGTAQASQAAQAATQAFDRVAEAAASAFREFDALPAALRSRLLPGLQEASNNAIELGSAIASGAVTGDRQIQALVARLGILAERFRELSSFSVDGLFRAPRDTRNVAQLNQAVVQLDSQFTSLGASSRSFLQPFVQQVQQASLAIRDAEIADRPRREINSLVADYRQAVRSLEAVISQVQRTEQAFARSTPQQGLAARLDGLIERYNRLGESGQRATRATGEAARDAVASSQDPNASSTARVRAREALDVAEREITSQERRQRVGDIFADSRSGIDAYIDRVGELEQRYQRMSAAERRALAAQRADLRRAAADAAATGQDTEAAVLRRQAAAFGASLDNADAQRARDTRLQDVRDTFQRSVTALPVNADDLRQQFRALGGQLQSLELGDRLSIAPLLEQYVQLEQATNGAGQEQERFAEKLQAILAIEERIQQVREQGRASGPQGPQPPPGFRPVSDTVGPALDDPSRQVGILGSAIAATKGQIDQLPLALRTQFLPAIEAAERQFTRLNALGPAATADEIENVVASLRTLTSSAQRATQAFNFRNAFGGDGTGGLELGLQARSLQGYSAQLQLLQSTLSRVSSEARGPALASFNALREAIGTAFANGTLDTQLFRQQIAGLTTDAVRTTAAVANISPGRLGRDLQRAGDVGRRGFDNISLALNQAAFAVDDFLSSTGGLEFQLRAISNNVTQLAFILGGTTGLFIGLGAVIGGQAAVGISKWINSGRSAEDQTKALNDALARQKSLVEDLAQAFRSLGDDISRVAFSAPAQEARAFERQIEDIRKKQRESRERRAADLSPDVQVARADQNRIDRELGTTTSIGRAARLIRDRQDAAQREQAAVAAANRPLDGREVLAVVTAARVREATRSGFSGSSRDPATRQRIDEAIAAARAEVPLGTGVDERRAQRNALVRRIEELRPNVLPRNAILENLPFSPRANAERDRQIFAQLEITLARLDNELLSAIDELSVQIVQGSRAAALSIGSAQEDVADAIRRGVSGAGVFQANLDSFARQLDVAYKQLEDARNIQDPQDPSAREAAVRQAQTTIRDVENARFAINERAREVRLGRTFGGDRATQALSQLSGNERFANEYARLTARLTSAVDGELSARRELEQAIRGGNGDQIRAAQANLELANKASDAAAAAAELAIALEQAVGRIRAITESAASESLNIANNAQRRFTDRPTEQNRQVRDAAEAQLIEDRRRIGRANAAVDRARAEAQADPRIAAIDRQLQDIRNQREDLAANARITGQEADPRQMEGLAQQEADLLSQREARLQELTQAERQQADAIAQEIAARNRMIQQLEKQIQFDEELLRRQRGPEGDALRGLDLSETPGQRLGRETAQGLADIDAAFRERGRQIVNEAGGLFDIDQQEQARLDQNEADRQAAIARFLEDQARAAAPAIFGLADSVANALLQGPSRAALNATDVSTVEGQRELNRLLRGDDSARDQNIVELEKQSQSLKEATTYLKDIADKIGVTVDL